VPQVKLFANYFMKRHKIYMSCNPEENTYVQGHTLSSLSKVWLGGGQESYS
jgi:hypothetical protein